MRNNKKTVRFTETDLHRIIEESVKAIISECGYKTKGVVNVLQ